MATVHKKNITKKPKQDIAGKKSSHQPQNDVGVSQPQTAPQAPVNIPEPVAVPTPSKDPLANFKEKMIEEEKQPLFSPSPQKNFMWPILFVVFISLALLAGVFIYKQSTNKEEKINVVSLSPTSTPLQTPTEVPVDLSKYEIRILNGSEIDGEAGRQKDNLEGEGFKVSSIGNAENSDYAKTIIQAKEDVDKDFLDKLKIVLEKSFVIGEKEELSSDADSDVIIIIGSSKN